MRYLVRCVGILFLSLLLGLVLIVERSSAWYWDAEYFYFGPDAQTDYYYGKPCFMPCHHVFGGQGTVQYDSDPLFLPSSLLEEWRKVRGYSDPGSVEFNITDGTGGQRSESSSNSQSGPAYRTGRYAYPHDEQESSDDPTSPSGLRGADPTLSSGLRGADPTSSSGLRGTGDGDDGDSSGRGSIFDRIRSSRSSAASDRDGSGSGGRSSSRASDSSVSSECTGSIFDCVDGLTGGRSSDSASGECTGSIFECVDGLTGRDRDTESRTAGKGGCGIFDRVEELQGPRDHPENTVFGPVPVLWDGCQD